MPRSHQRLEQLPSQVTGLSQVRRAFAREPPLRLPAPCKRCPGPQLGAAGTAALTSRPPPAGRAQLTRLAVTACSLRELPGGPYLHALQELSLFANQLE